MKIAAIIAAAGRSSRFESGHKLLADLDGMPLIRHSITAIDGAPVAEIVLVIASDGQALADAAGPGRWRVIVNTHAASGLSSSIQAGLAAIDPSSAGAMIVLADMPGVTSGSIAQLCQTFRDGGGTKITFPQTADGRQGNPVLWPRALFGELMKLTGDTGGKAVLAAHPHFHAPVTMDDHAATCDIDTVSDLAKIKTLEC
jgi:molybdenum cofactor cytidylyltransferase